MPVQRLSEIFEPWIKDELEKAAPNDEIAYEFGLTATEWSPATFGVVLQMKSPIIGSYVGCHIAFPKGLVMEEEEVRMNMRQAVEFLQQQRTAALAQGNGSGGGLHLPGS